jgi:hypothetical protein
MNRKLISLGAIAVAVAAISGISYAAIPGQGGVISACRDSKGALKVIDAEAGQTCNANQQLLTWNQEGPQGPAGPAGASGYEIVDVITGVGALDLQSGLAPCPAGKKVVGGGGWAVGQGGLVHHYESVLVRSAPVATGDGWLIVARELVPTPDVWGLHIRALCVNAS